jgi:hypothetical protein
MKSLIERLGLDHPDHMHKLRILASAHRVLWPASEAPKAVRYLPDLYALALAARIPPPRAVLVHGLIKMRRSDGDLIV